MFNQYGIDRLTEWKKFRDSIESEDKPLEACASFWAKAPFVSPYLDPSNPSSWPDPWKLVLDSKYDNLAIALGMLYTLQLTQRFMGERFEIYMSINNKENDYFLLVGDTNVLNMEYMGVTSKEKLFSKKVNMIHSITPKQ